MCGGSGVRVGAHSPGEGQATQNHARVRPTGGAAGQGGGQPFEPLEKLAKEEVSREQGHLFQLTEVLTEVQRNPVQVSFLFFNFFWGSPSSPARLRRGD